MHTNPVGVNFVGKTTATHDVERACSEEGGRLKGKTS